MYNGKAIKELLEKRGLQNQALLTALGLNPKQNSIQSLITGNPTAKRLEQIADFFNVTIDTFFIREGGIELSSTDSKNGLKSASAYVLQQEVKHRDDVIKFKDDMLREKDERIKLLEELLEVYRAPKSNAK
jgi:transcriptional regulator with XRE-family HTH domain